MMTLRQFLEVCGLQKIDLVQGKGRAFSTTPVGTIFVAEKLDWKKNVFITQHQGGEDKAGKSYAHLKGSYWFVNAAVELIGSVSADGLIEE